MKTRKNPPVKFTKQKMIDDINSLRKITMESEIVTSEICKTYPSLYNYKTVNDLIELGFLRLTQKKAKSSYYKWNFDSKVDLETFDALFKNVISYKKNIKQKYAQNRIIRIKKQELINSQQKANLKVEEPILEPVKEVVMEEKQLPRLKKLSFAQQLMYPDELARDLGLVPTEEEIEAWKKEIAFWKNETERLIIKFEKASIELQSLKTEMKRKDDYVYDMSFKNQDELDKVVKHYEKLLSEKTLEPTFVPKEEDKKPLVSVLDEIKKQKIESQKPIKYLKLFGYMIYEKN
jgi:hypothetical protein